MYRQYSSRNQRNKGIKVKHALQVFGFLAVCFWLIYQVKHSHASDPLESEGSGALIKIGRKDIRPPYQELVTVNEQQHNQAVEEENTDVENSSVEDRSPVKKVEDEHEMEKSDAEVYQEEDTIINEVGEISDDGNVRKQENSAEGGGHGGDKRNHEAREELYKADDASSAVTHDKLVQTTENENKFVTISGHLHANILELENDENHGDEANSGAVKERLEGDGGGTDLAANVTTSETKESSLKSSNGSYPNNTLLEASDDVLAANGTTDATKRNPWLSGQNVTETMPELDHDQGSVALEQEGNSTLDVENHLSYSNSTDRTGWINSESDLEDFSKPSNGADSFTVVRITRSEHSLEDGSNAHKNAKSVSRDGTDEVLESAFTVDENAKEVNISSTDLSGSAKS